MEFLQSISKEIFTQKYMLHGEADAEQVFSEVAEEIARVEDPRIRDQIKEEFEELLSSGKFMPGGRILANARTYAPPKSRNYNNCFTIDIEDSMEGIYSSVYEDAMISRMGGGVGFDVSKIRPENSKTSNGGDASGPISFLEVFNASAKTIQSGGARRAAHIALLKISHPDVKKFITVKQGDTNKKLTQFNISVSITDEFMQAVKDDTTCELSFDGTVYEVIKARDLYNMLVENAFYHNEPGVFFTDRVERDNNAWWAYKMDRCNPCGEIPMPAYSLCCLGSMNLALYVVNPFEHNAYFDYEAFCKDIKIAVRFLDNVLDATQYPLEKIEDFSKQWRRIGLGFTALGDALAMLRIPYGSDESKKFAYQFSQAMMTEAYTASAELAAEKGMAPGLKTKKLFKTIVDERIFDSKFIAKLPINVLTLIGKYGLRNIGLLTCAPTGTISLSVGNNCSSGIEPIFSLYYDRNIRTGKGDETKKETVYDYAYLKYLDWVKSRPLSRRDLSLTEEAQALWTLEAHKWFTTAFDVKPEDAIDIQGIIQNHVDHSISKTLNFDGKAIGIEGYKHLFEYAYDRGLKGFTSFNTTSGSMKGILEAPAEKDKIIEKPDNYVVRSDAPKRPKQLPCDIHYVHANNEDFIVLVGKLNGSLYEMFVDIKNGHDFGGATEGLIVKRAKGEYALESADGSTFLDSLSKDFNGTYGVLARMLSMSLRHGVPLQFIIDQLQRSKEFLGFEKAVARVLKKYMKEGEVLEMKCPQCGGKMEYASGCPTCRDCGYGKCS